MPAIYGNAYDITQAPGIVVERFTPVGPNKVAKGKSR